MGARDASFRARPASADTALLGQCPSRHAPPRPLPFGPQSLRQSAAPGHAHFRAPRGPAITGSARGGASRRLEFSPSAIFLVTLFPRSVAFSPQTAQGSTPGGVRPERGKTPGSHGRVPTPAGFGPAPAAARQRPPRPLTAAGRPARPAPRRLRPAGPLSAAARDVRLGPAGDHRFVTSHQGYGRFRRGAAAGEPRALVFPGPGGPPLSPRPAR